jgi:hypothetical protein
VAKTGLCGGNGTAGRGFGSSDINEVGRFTYEWAKISILQCGKALKTV